MTRRSKPTTLAELEARWRKAYDRERKAPLWIIRVYRRPRYGVDWVGCWLATHAGGRAAEWWWRALRMW